MFVHLLAALAEWERDRLAERTSEGMAYAREKYGHLPGRRRGTPEELAARIVRERMGGATLATVADGLNSDGYATTRGKDWRPGTVHMVLRRRGCCELRACVGICALPAYRSAARLTSTASP
jgi:DNA invertase Pin-like site-specific DNA recombinase